MEKTVVYIIKSVIVIVASFLLGLSCKKNSHPVSSKKAITVFQLKAVLNTGLTTDISAVIIGDSIKLAVPAAAGLTALTPSISYTGESISPANAKTQNFSNPVVYTIAAEDGSTKSYVVVVRFQNTSKEILSFSFNAKDNTGILTQDAVGIINNDTILVSTDAFNVSTLSPFITHNGKQVAPFAGQNHSFADAVTYTVTAEDGSTRNYTVIVRTTASLFIGGMDSTLYALDAATGKLRWKHRLTFPVRQNPTFANGIVYIGNITNFYAFNSTTGALIWKTTLPGSASTSPQVVDNTVYVALSGVGLYPESSMIALDALTGNMKWKAPVSANFMFCNPTVSDGRVVTSSFNGDLYCYDAAAGSLLWTFRVGVVEDDNPLVVNGTLYMGSEYYSLLAIDMTTGVKKWAIPNSFDQNGQSVPGISGSPTIENGVLYTSGLRAYDTATGYLKWEYPVQNAVVLRPVCENGTIFGTSPGDIVYAINTDGSLKWRYGTIGAISTPVDRANATVAHNVVFTGCGINNNLIALNGANGQLIWTYKGTRPFISGPCAVDAQGNAFHSNLSGAHQ
jgi:outer membrane protein assembly factor BamB